VRFAVKGEETDGKNSGAVAVGKVQTKAAGVRVKNWFCDEVETGAAGTGCDSGEEGAAQHALPQWQELCAPRPTPAADACAGTGVPASNRLQTMASVVFTF
jgi:hypothetical protein